jgi:DNA-3-methyladenine glycosylase II
MSRTDPLSPGEFERARRLLMRRDPRLGDLIKRVGPCRLPESRQRAPFLGLVRVVLAQQLSAKAAQTIFNRVVALADGNAAGLKTRGSMAREPGAQAPMEPGAQAPMEPGAQAPMEPGVFRPRESGDPSFTPAQLLGIDPAALRAAGVSRPKIAYLRDLAERVQDGRLPLESLEAMSDAEVIAAITAVKGFGQWSAEMFLIFRLNRPDVLPLTDLGIVKGMQKLFGMKRRPAARTMLRLAEPWRPYRSVASWYLWRIHD